MEKMEKYVNINGEAEFRLKADAKAVRLKWISVASAVGTFAVPLVAFYAVVITRTMGVAHFVAMLITVAIAWTTYLFSSRRYSRRLKEEISSIISEQVAKEAAEFEVRLEAEMAATAPEREARVKVYFLAYGPYHRKLVEIYTFLGRNKTSRGWVSVYLSKKVAELDGLARVEVLQSDKPLMARHAKTLEELCGMLKPEGHLN